MTSSVGTNAAYNYLSNLWSAHKVPITAGWPNAVWDAKFSWHFYLWPVLGIEPQATWSHDQVLYSSYSSYSTRSQSCEKINKCKCTCFLSRYPTNSADCTIYIIRTHPFTAHLLLNELRVFALFCSCSQSLQFIFVCSTTYPSLPGQQRQRVMKMLPNTSTIEQWWQLNPRPFDNWVQRSSH